MVGRCWPPLLHANPPCDAALLDLMLPGMDGLSLCETIRRDDPDIGIEIMDAAERDSYECGEGAEIIFDLRADIDKPETWR